MARQSVQQNEVDQLPDAASCQSRNLRQQLIPELQFISWGNMRQGIPLRSTNKTPVEASLV